MTIIYIFSFSHIGTLLEGKIIDYHIDSNDFSDIYQEAIEKSIYDTTNFWHNQLKSNINTNISKKPKLLGPKSKRRSDDSSSDEDYLPINKKTKSRKSFGSSKINNEVDYDEIPQILKTFDKNPGFGDSLTELLPAEHVQSKDAVAAFLMFVLERQKTWWNKTNGQKIPTSNQVIATKWFTNMYR